MLLQEHWTNACYHSAVAAAAVLVVSVAHCKGTAYNRSAAAVAAPSAAVACCSAATACDPFVAAPAELVGHHRRRTACYRSAAAILGVVVSIDHSIRSTKLELALALLCLLFRTL